MGDHLRSALPASIPDTARDRLIRNVELGIISEETAMRLVKQWAERASNERAATEPKGL